MKTRNRQKQKRSKATKFELIGKCRVESGKLLVCDPCYIDAGWNDPDYDDPTGAGYFRDSEGRTFALSLYHRRPPIEGCIMFDAFDAPLPECGGKTPNEMVDSWVKVEPETTGEFNYRACCMAIREASAGQLDYCTGLPGAAGVVFSSGYGDGVYPVYAKRDKDGRIVEIRINMELEHSIGNEGIDSEALEGTGLVLDRGFGPEPHESWSV